MDRGIESEDSIEGEKRAFINIKMKSINKNYPVGENRLAGQGRARQDRTGLHKGNIDDELARDCKHKEIIREQMRRVMRKTQVGQINQIIR